jgi:hypothetical protein
VFSEFSEFGEMQRTKIYIYYNTCFSFQWIMEQASSRFIIIIIRTILVQVSKVVPDLTCKKKGKTQTIIHKIIAISNVDCILPNGHVRLWYCFWIDHVNWLMLDGSSQPHTIVDIFLCVPLAVQPRREVLALPWRQKYFEIMRALIHSKKCFDLTRLPIGQL